MSKPPSPHPLIFVSTSLLFLLPALPATPLLPNPDPETVQQQTFLPNNNPSPPATIPSFPEQSTVAGCPIALPDELFPAVRASCITRHGSANYGPLHRSRCCPVLAAWLYSAYATTALGRSAGAPPGKPYDMPLMPDDSEACVDGLETAMGGRGLELPRPNATCDVVYCYCGIRLHQMSCPGAFFLNGEGDLAGDRRVERLERDCSSKDGGGRNNGGIAGCSKCLRSLYKLNKAKGGNSTALSERTSRMRFKDCELMGLTWLLAKNRSTYMNTVTSVLRVIMMSENHSDGGGPISCSLNSDGMPLAVDSSEISGAAYPASGDLRSLAPGFLLLCCLMYMRLTELLRVIYMA